MKLTNWTLMLVILGLVLGGVLIDGDHLLIDTNGGVKISNLDCIVKAFLSLTSEEAKTCMINREFGRAYLHDWRLGLFMFGFVASYYVVKKNE